MHLVYIFDILLCQTYEWSFNRLFRIHLFGLMFASLDDIKYVNKCTNSSKKGLLDYQTIFFVVTYCLF